MANKLQIKRSAVPGKVPTVADLDLGELAINTYDGKVYMKKNVSGVETIVLMTGAGAGDVLGPASSGDKAIARFSGTGGKTIQNSSASIDDSGNINATSHRSSGTSADLLSKGTTAQRPASPTVGEIRFNTTLNVVEAYHSSLGWIPLSNTFQATGGAITTYTDGTGTYNVHTFTSSGTFQVMSGSGNVDYICIAGGGGGGHGGSPPQFSGGGAGGVLSGTTGVLVGGYAVTIGGGGAGGSTGSNGANSSVFGVTSIGGGYGGGGGGQPGGNGGSGGGEGGTGGGGSYAIGYGTAGQGNNGGYRSPDNNDYAGGGGGYSGVGGNGGVGGTSGTGGAGFTSSINGTSTNYAGGGGRYDTGYRNGYFGSPNAGANSGSGGAGSGGAGASGIVIIRYKIG